MKPPRPQTPSPISRRSLLRGAAALAASAPLAACLPGVDSPWPDPGAEQCSWQAPQVSAGDPNQAGRVVEVYNPAMTSGAKLNAPVVEAELQRLLLGLSGKSDLAGAWAALIPGLQAGQVVGIKVNVLNPKVPTHLEVVGALVKLLRAGAGLSAAQVVVWDRRLDELTKIGFTDAALGATVEGTLDTPTEKGSGRGYEFGTVCIGGQTTHLSNILTRRIDHLINVAVMKRHTISGVTGVMKNHYGSIDNPGDFHDVLGQGNLVLDRRFDRAIPGLNALDEVVRKTRLLLVDASVGVCKGGTDSPADCAPNRLLAGLDPVAIDLRTRQIRDEARGSLGKDPETISDGWLAAAEKVGLGKQSLSLETPPG